MMKNKYIINHTVQSIYQAFATEIQHKSYGARNKEIATSAKMNSLIS